MGILGYAESIREDAVMGEAAPLNKDDAGQGLAVPANNGGISPLRGPIMMNANQMGNRDGGGLRYVEGEEQGEKGRKREGAVVRGLKELQQLQKQTIAVLEAVKANLEGIEQVLRSPEATRGLEKQQNAATLLAKGFAHEAVEQAVGAAQLLPANPEAQLLLSLSLAADQQFDASLAAARKGLALFDRRHHGLAIEAGLLHALAALGCGSEAAERWGAIIEALPIPVLLEHTGRIANCFPSDAPIGQLDDMIFRRLGGETVAEEPAEGQATRWERVPTRANDIPPVALLAGLDASGEMLLPKTRRAVLGQIARRLQGTRDAGEIVRFLSDCLVPMGNRGLTRSTNAMGRASVKRLLRLNADAMTLHRAMMKLDMAGAAQGAREIAGLLEHWRREGSKVARARRWMLLAMGFISGGAVILAYVLWGAGAIHGKHVVMSLIGAQIEAVWFGPALMVVGCVLGVVALMGRNWRVELPNNRPALTAEELGFVRSGPIKHSLRGVLRG